MNKITLFTINNLVGLWDYQNFEDTGYTKFNLLGCYVSDGWIYGPEGAWLGIKIG